MMDTFFSTFTICIQYIYIYIYAIIHNEQKMHSRTTSILLVGNRYCQISSNCWSIKAQTLLAKATLFLFFLSVARLTLLLLANRLLLVLLLVATFTLLLLTAWTPAAFSSCQLFISFWKEGVLGDFDDLDDAGVFFSSILVKSKVSFNSELQSEHSGLFPPSGSLPKRQSRKLSIANNIQNTLNLSRA